MNVAGCIIYQMVTGIPPFTHDSSEYIIFQKVRHKKKVQFSQRLCLIEFCYRFKILTTVSMMGSMNRLKI